MSNPKKVRKRSHLVNCTAIAMTCDRIAVNFMKTMVDLHAKHQVLEDKLDNLEEIIKNKVDKKEVNQLQKEIGSMREGQNRHKLIYVRVVSFTYQERQYISNYTNRHKHRKVVFVDGLPCKSMLIILLCLMPFYPVMFCMFNVINNINLFLVFHNYISETVIISKYFIIKI